MPKCPKGFRWDAKAKRCVPKGGGARTSPDRGSTSQGEFEAASEDDNVYIGVPSDYRAVGMGRYKYPKRGGPQFGRPGGVSGGMPTHTEKPIYKEGGEFRQLAGYSPDAIFQIQTDLVYMGLLEEEGWIPGVNDPKTAAAFKKVLAAANTQARTWQDVLPEMVMNVEAAGMGGGGSGEDVTLPPFVFQPTPGEDLGASLTDVAGRGEPYSGIGREATDAEKLQFAQEYQGQEYGSQRAAYDAESEYARAQAAGMPGGGEVTINQPPSERVAAEEWLKKNRTGEYIGTRAARAADAWYGLLQRSWKLPSG